GAPLAPAERLGAAAARAHAAPRPPSPPLLKEADGRLAFRDRYREPGGKARPLTLVPLPGAPSPEAVDRAPLERRDVDVLLVVPAGFQEAVECGGRPRLLLLGREEDGSRLAEVRALGALNRWKRDLRGARLARQGPPPHFAEPFAVSDPGPDPAAHPPRGGVGR